LRRDDGQWLKKREPRSQTIASKRIKYKRNKKKIIQIPAGTGQSGIDFSFLA
jgi:hypothetical protein